VLDQAIELFLARRGFQDTPRSPISGRRIGVKPPETLRYLRRKQSSNQTALKSYVARAIDGIDGKIEDPRPSAKVSPVFRLDDHGFRASGRCCLIGQLDGELSPHDADTRASASRNIMRENRALFATRLGRPRKTKGEMPQKSEGLPSPSPGSLPHHPGLRGRVARLGRTRPA